MKQVSRTKAPRWQKLLFGKRVKWAFRPKMGLFFVLLSLPVFGVLRWIVSDGDSLDADIAWVVLMSLTIGFFAAATDYFDD